MFIERPTVLRFCPDKFELLNQNAQSSENIRPNVHFQLEFRNKSYIWKLNRFAGSPPHKEWWLSFANFSDINVLFVCFLCYSCLPKLDVLCIACEKGCCLGFKHSCTQQTKSN
jgi:hypothetical protein